MAWVFCHRNLFPKLTATLTLVFNAILFPKYWLWQMISIFLHSSSVLFFFSAGGCGSLPAVRCSLICKKAKALHSNLQVNNPCYFFIILYPTVIKTRKRALFRGSIQFGAKHCFDSHSFISHMESQNKLRFWTEISLYFDFFGVLVLNRQEMRANGRESDIPADFVSKIQWQERRQSKVWRTPGEIHWSANTSHSWLPHLQEKFTWDV